jgi:hypothetical protein
MGERTKMMHHLLNLIFGRAEEINGGERCPTYLYRWVLLKICGRAAYLHKLVGDDWSFDFHDHPSRFVSVGLWGSYLEETPNGEGQRELRRYRAPWVRSFPPEYRHRLSTPWGTCWTLVIVLRKVRPRGFWHDGKFIAWRDYVEGVDGIADKMKSCE